MKGKDKIRGTALPDFLRYIENRMSGKEKNSFEKELQKDPFTEEAVEGLSGITPDEVSNDMEMLQKRLKARTNRRVKIIFFRIAASVAVLMILSSVFIIVNRNKVTTSKAEIAYNNQPLEINQLKAITEPEKAGSEAASAKKSIETAKKKKSPDLRKTEGEKSEPGMNRDVPSDKAKIAYIPASVVDSINLQVKQDVVAEESLKADTEMKEVAEPSPAELNETLVAGYGVKRAKAADAINVKAGYKAPEPVGGKENFDKYIMENSRNPEALKTGTTAEVELSLTILKTGVIDKIKVIKSPGKKFSDEAIRLIKEGPSWKPAESNGENIDAEARVRVVFK